MKKSYPKPVILATNGSELGGGDIALRNLAVKMDSDKWRMIMVYPHPGPISLDLEQKGFKVHYFDDLDIMARGLGKIYIFKFLVRLVKSTSFFIKLINKERVALVHTNSSALLSPGLAAFICRIPHAWQVREIIERPWWIRRFLRLFMPLLANRIICVSSQAAKLFSRAAIEKKVTVVNDGVDLNLFYPRTDIPETKTQLGIPNGRLVIGYCGRLIRRKGVVVLIDSILDLLDKGYDLHLLILGVVVPKYQDQALEIQQLLTAKGLKSRHTLLLEVKDVAKYLSASDMVVQPSIEPEGFGLTALEAMALGKPVIATPLGGPLDLITPRQNGLFAIPGNSRDLALKIEDLIKDKRLREALGSQALNTVRQRFDAALVSKRVGQVYQKLMEPMQNSEADQ
ncbi:glycosyltransferase family 4 protein [candidate division TA06 bacterium]|nr:glycosyltransferase family 4 protein [candidate division TA06 bacterium]